VPAVTIADAADSDLDVVRAIAAGETVSMEPALLAALQECCDQARLLLSDGRPVYGVNTGMGALHGIRLTGEQQRARQRNLMLARATGGPPWLDRAEARAIIGVRLLTFRSGDAAVSAGLCQRLIELLNLDLVPAIPRTGMGAAGEIMQLAHAFGPLAGIGAVLRPDGALQPASQALQDHGLTEYSLGPKEGIALIQGVAGTTGLSVLRLAEATRLTDLMEVSAALSIAAVGASRDPYHAALGRGDDILDAVLARIRARAGADSPTRSLQAPVSFRVAGPVLAHLHRAAGLLEAAVRRAIVGVTDSPAFVGDQFVGTAGFHGIDLAAHCDQLTVAFCHAAEVAAARIHRLMDPAVTGLPAQLAREPGLNAGLSPVHKRAAGEVHEMRRLATATPVGLIETSGGQEDVQSFAWEAADKLRSALRHARAVTACELLTAYQAIELSGRESPSGCASVLQWLGRVVGPITGDRTFGVDIEHLIQDWASGSTAEGTRENLSK
jgi:histidine ammonia-lyase